MEDGDGYTWETVACMRKRMVAYAMWETRVYMKKTVAYMREEVEEDGEEKEADGVDVLVGMRSRHKR